MNVTVLMGGPSAEREVSLRSGAAVAAALEESGVHVRSVVLEGTDVELPRGTDVVFVVLHGTFGEDGTLQQVLEDRGMPYTFSGPTASARAFDKITAKQAFESAGVPTPRWTALDGRHLDLTLVKHLGLPLVIKPARQGSSVGVTIVREAADLAAACAAAAAFDDRLLAEEFIAGRELTVAVLEDRALPVIEVKPKQNFFTYDAKYTSGQTDYLVPAPLADDVRDQVQRVALQAHQCLGCRDLSRVDVMLGADGRAHVLEVNTVPGFTATSLVPKAAKAAGISFPALCGQLVQNALARSAQKVAA